VLLLKALLEKPNGELQIPLSLGTVESLPLELLIQMLNLTANAVETFN